MPVRPLRAARAHDRSRATRVVTTAALAGLVLAACAGDGGEEGADDDVATSTGPAPVSGLDQVGTATVQILADGEMRGAEGMTSFSGSGSGFLVSDDGYIVTNNHVVTGAGSLRVIIGGDEDEEIPARVVGVSECNDLAVIQLTEDGDYPSLEWSTQPATPPLEVYAAGFPLGDPEFTMTRGIVSKAEADGESPWASVSAVIEHDAAIQPGNSGGPLVDAEGRVVGVNYAGGDPGTGTSQFFAINADEAQAIVADLVAGGNDSIGVNGQAILDEENGLAGIWVAGVAPGGPASDAGVKPGDIITTFNGVAMESGTYEEYCDVLRSNSPESTMSLRVLRSDTEEMLEGELNGRELEATFSFATELSDEVEQGDGGGSTESAAPETVDLVDDTNTITVSVPANWDDTLTEPIDLLGTGALSPSITATTDLAAFENDAAPGVIMAYAQDVGDFPLDPLLDAAISGTPECTEGERDDYADSAFTGRYMTLDCGELIAIALVAVPSADPDSIMVVIAGVQTEADLHAIDTILSTFNLV